MNRLSTSITAVDTSPIEVQVVVYAGLAAIIGAITQVLQYAGSSPGAFQDWHRLLTSAIVGASTAALPWLTAWAKKLTPGG